MLSRGDIKRICICSERWPVTEEENGSNVVVYDADGGISLEIEIANGISIMLYMEDKTAQEMVDVVQNKLNARWRI